VEIDVMNTYEAAVMTYWHAVWIDSHNPDWQTIVRTHQCLQPLSCCSGDIRMYPGYDPASSCIHVACPYNEHMDHYVISARRWMEERAHRKPFQSKCKVLILLRLFCMLLHPCTVDSSVYCRLWPYVSAVTPA